MFCRWCGKQIDVGLTKCKYCGNQLNALEAIGVSNDFTLDGNDNIQSKSHLDDVKSDDSNNSSMESVEKEILEAKIRRLQVYTIVLAIIVICLSITLLITY